MTPYRCIPVDLMDAEHPITRHLYRKIYSTRDFEHFAAQWIDDVDSNGLELARATQVIDEPGMRVHLMPNEIAVAHYTRSGKRAHQWAAFRTKSYVERQDRIARWSTFARGHWTRECPNEPGMYPVVRRDSAVPESTPFTVFVEYEFRRLQSVEGVVRDVTTFCPATFRTEWKGWWWSEPLPAMNAPVLS